MFKRIGQRINSLFGLGNARSLPAPHLVALTDGLMVTTTRAIAWFEIGTSNTDTATEEELDAELEKVLRTIPPVLTGHDCHLKVLWGRVDGQQYLDGLDHPATTWDDARADWLDDYDVPDRRILLGVVIDANRADEAQSAARAAGGAALGLPVGQIAPREMRNLHGRARELGRRLASTSWNINLATVETIAWMVSREMHRGALMPQAGVIHGAGLAHLTSGRVEPYSDHLVALDDQGRPARHIAVLALSQFPEVIEIPGLQEWLRHLASISRTTGDGATVPVVADVSQRFTILQDAEAQRLVESARTLAKEQRQSAAKHATGETSQDIEETEIEMERVGTALKRSGLHLVKGSPRIVVSEASREDLDAAVSAVVTHFAAMGITAYRAVDEQAELWLETLPGDQERVPDLGHTMEDSAWFGSWFWGGAQVGDRAGMPMIGYQTGSTPGIVRGSLVAAAVRGSATTSVMCGRSGSGKTTALMLAEIDAVLNYGAWVAHISTKGDDLGAVDVVDEYGGQGAIIQLDAENPGVADLFLSLPREDAILAVARCMAIAAPPSLRDTAETIGLEAVAAEAEQESPTTWGAVQRLVNHDDPSAARLGSVLQSFARTPLGAPVFGRPLRDGNAGGLPTEAGLWIIQLAGLQMPPEGSHPDNWDQTHRLSLAVFRAVAQWLTAVGYRPDLRELRKLVAVPEVHIILRSADGASWLGELARLGRALGVNMVLDTQDASSIRDITGLVEQLFYVWIFRLSSVVEQDAGTELLGQEPSRAMRRLIGELMEPTNPDEDEVKGHCVMRDNNGRVATLQWVIPTERIAVQLATNPDSDRHRRDLYDDDPEAEETAGLNGHAKAFTGANLDAATEPTEV